MWKAEADTVTALTSLLRWAYGKVGLNEGPKFDPNMHQAMFEVPNPDVPNGTVVEVVQTGYALGDRVLRPAMVGVAKGGPKPASTGGDNGSLESQPGA